MTCDASYSTGRWFLNELLFYDLGNKHPDFVNSFPWAMINCRYDRLFAGAVGLEWYSAPVRIPERADSQHQPVPCPPKSRW